MATDTELIAQLYVGFYDRAPDPVGLQYWIGRLEAGVSIQDIGDSFAASPEASDTYPYFTYPDLLSRNEFLAQVYQNVFARRIDPDGLNYYGARLEAGESAGSVVASILGNASTNEGSPDQAYLQNKVDAGLHWSMEAEASNANIYQANGRLTDQADTSAHCVLECITTDPATVDTANAQTDIYFSGGGAGGDCGCAGDDDDAGGGGGSGGWVHTFTLTPGMDFADGTGSGRNGPKWLPDTGFKFTSRNETVNANQDTIRGKDVLLDGHTSDQDMFNLSLSGASSAVLPTMQNIENIRIRTDSPVQVDASYVNGTQNIENDRSTADLEVNSLQNIVTASIVENDGGDDTILNFADSVLSGNADETTVTFDHSKYAGAVSLGAQTSNNGFETLNLVIKGEANVQTWVDSISSGSTLQTLNIDNQSVDHNFYLYDVLTGVKNVDASASVGNVDIIVDSTLDVTVAGGSGDDVFWLENGLDGNDVVDGGGGYDVLRMYGSSFATGLKVTNIEELDIFLQTVAGTYDMDNFGAGEDSIQKITLSGNTAATVNLNNVDKGVAVELNDSANAVTINVPDAAAGGSDVLHVGLNADYSDTVGALTANSIETLNINSGGAAKHTIATLADNALQTLNITGDQDLSVAWTAASGVGGTTIDLVDATDFTGDLWIHVGDGVGAVDQVGVQIKGGSGDNTIVAGANDDAIVTQGGDDYIVGNGGADVITTGGGTDIIVYNAAADSFWSAAGHTMDHITDFQAGVNGDTFDFTGVVALVAGDANLIQSATIGTSTNAGLGGALDGLPLTFVAGSMFAVVTVQGDEAVGTYLIADSDGTAGFSSTTDLVINITGYTGTLEAANFLL